jgi:hypothetical protein
VRATPVAAATVVTAQPVGAVTVRAQPVSAAAAGSSWSCKMCTYMNSKPNALACEMCNSMRD